MSNRRALLAKVHIALKDLGIDDAAYRGVLAELFGKKSAKDLSDKQLVALCEHFTRRGWEPKRKTSKGVKPARKDFYEIPKGVGLERIKKYIAGLWKMLGYELAGLDTRVKKQFGVDKFLWLDDMAALQILAKDLWNRCRKRDLDPEPW